MGTWDWIEESLLPNLYYTEDYTGSPLNAYNDKFLANSVSMRLGPPRLRQIRNKPRKLLRKLYINAMLLRVCYPSMRYYVVTVENQYSI